MQLEGFGSLPASNRIVVGVQTMKAQRHLKFRSGLINKLLASAIILLYSGWISYVIWRDKCLDFYVYYLAAYGFAHKVDMYATGSNAAVWASLAQELGIRNYTMPYLYPPFTAMLVWPLTFFPPRWAAFIWLTTTAMTFIASAWLLGNTFPRSFGTTLSLALLLFFVPSLTTLHAGQVNGFLLLTLTFALYAFVRQRCLWTGIGIAIGAMLKIVPLAHLIYLAWRRCWWAVLASVAAIFLLSLLAVPLVGVKGLISYVDNFFLLTGANQLVTSGASQSVFSFFARLLVAEDGRWCLTHNPAVAWWLGWGIALAIIGLTMVLCWPNGASERILALEFALVTAAVNLVMHHTWYHQLVLLLIPFFVVTEHALADPRRRWVLLPVAMGYLATNVHGLFWHHLEFNPLLVSMPFYTSVMLWGLLAWMIAREKKVKGYFVGVLLR